MSRKSLYLVLAVAGAVAPYVFFARFFAAEGLTGDFVTACFANGAAGGITADLLVSSVVFWVFVFTEARRAGVGQPWVFVVVNLLIGLSCALPLFLWARERALGLAAGSVASPAAIARG